MFDIPLNTSTYVNKHRVRERQLRYRYINEHTKQYKKYKRHVYKKKVLRRKYSDKKYGSSLDENFNNSDNNNNNNNNNHPENKEYLIARRNKKKTKWTTVYRQDTQELESENNAFGSTKYEEDSDISETEDTNNANINDTDEDARIKLEKNDYDNDDDNNNLDEEEAFISSKDERKYFSRHHKPQQTYELWIDPNTTTHRPLQTNIIRFPEWSKIETRTKSKLKEPLAQTTHSLKAYQKLIPYGLYLHDPHNIRSYHKRPTIQDKHIETMVILLRIHISKLNWSMAYRIFALLIRIPRVDIRSIWQYGVAILNQSENLIQCLTFLEWMHSVFSSKKAYHLTNLLQSDPVFRGSSRNHTAQFSLTWLWNSLIFYSTKGDQTRRNKHDYEKGNMRIKEEDGEYDEHFLNKYDKEGMERLIEKITEMILSPPFMEDGEVWFILAMCHMMRADYTSLCYLNRRGGQPSYEREKLYDQVTYDINKVIKYLKESKSRQNGDFLYPNDYIMRSLTQIELRVSEEEEEEDDDDDDEEEEKEASLSDDTNKPTHMSLTNKRKEIKENNRYQLVSQAINESDLRPELDSSLFQVEEENSFLQTLDMPDYLLEDDYNNQYNAHDNFYTNRDSDDREYSSD
ncbi:Rrn11p PWA37_003008 [Arxiozyma heterogenica]|uniref:Rrn11p n=1 Tax=Arxiozyma heterogenica TaxID=278026 RepID=UPI002F1E6E4F